MCVGRNQHLQAIEFRPWIGRLEIDPFKVVDSFLETTLAKFSQPSQVVPMVVAAWVDTVGRDEVVARLVRPAIEIQGFCQPDIVQGIARSSATALNITATASSDRCSRTSKLATS